MSRTRDLGNLGEAEVARLLRGRGCTLLASQWRCRYGELDLVAREKKGTICFVEVKLRKDSAMAEAREFVTPAKQRKVRTAAMYYLMENPTEKQPRFDVMEVYAPQGQETRRPVIRHWPNAF